jgi:hypothetical protein
MKITRKQIRRIVVEESKRDLPISYYSDDLLMQEGLLDFLKGLFGPLLDFFKGAYSEAEKKVQGAWGDVTSQVTNTAKEVMGDAGDKIKSLTDLNLDDKKQAKVYYAAITPQSLKMMGAALEKIKSADAVKDWTPADDSDEAAKKWQNENGDAANGLWYAFGIMGGTADFYAENTDEPKAKAVAGEYDKVAKSGSPAEAIKYILSAGELIQQIGVNAKEHAPDAAEGLSKAGSEVVAAANALGSKIATSGKEQQKENLELRKMINQMIIQERKIIKGNSGR